MAVAHTARGEIWYANHRRHHFTHPPLLLIHGAAGSHLDWPINLRRLNAIVPDLSGHGKSSAMPSRDRIPLYAADMIALLDALELPSAVIVGHSMGGAIALTIALEASERVAGLILINTGAKLAVSPAILDNVVADQAAVGERLRAQLWSQHTPQQIRDLGYQQFMQTPPEVALDDYIACQHFDIREHLDRIQTPALVFGTAEDQMTPLKYAQYLAEHLPDAELIIAKDAGHMLPIEQAGFVADEVTRWLSTRFENHSTPKQDTD